MLTLNQNKLNYETEGWSKLWDNKSKLTHYHNCNPTQDPYRFGFIRSGPVPGLGPTVQFWEVPLCEFLIEDFY